MATSVLLAVMAIVCLDYFFNQRAAGHRVSRLRTSLEDVRASRDRRRLVVDTIPALVWTALPDGSRDFLNRGWQRYTGLAETDGLGWGWTAALHPEDRSKFTESWSAAVALAGWA